MNLSLERKKNLNVQGKITKVNRNSGSTKPTLEFTYDAMGQRLSKKVTESSGNVKTFYYIRDAQGNEMSRYVHYTDGLGDEYFVSEEHSIYGSSRLGLQTRRDTLYKNTTITPNYDYVFRDLGTKQYELSNHLGNVLATITDQNKPVSGGGITIDNYEPVVVSISDYYPFGSLIPNRSWSDASRVYRYGFNGKEEEKVGLGGGGSTYDYGFRIYNPNLSRFLSKDPLLGSFPWYTPYQFAGNKPVWCIDIDGLEAAPTNEGIGTSIGPSTDPNTILGPTVEFPAAVCKGKAPKLSNSDKALIFGINFGISAIVTGIIATVVTAIASPFVTIAAVAVGVYCLSKSIVELYTGKENWGTGDKMTESEKWSEAGALAGGVIGGGIGAKMGVKVKAKIKAHSKKYEVLKSANLSRLEDVGVGIKVSGGGIRETKGYNKQGASLENKLQKRQNQGYDFRTTDDMIKYGQDFFRRTGDNIIEFKDRFGNIHRLDRNTQEYGIICPDGTIQSVFKLQPTENSGYSNGDEYIEQQIIKYGAPTESNSSNNTNVDSDNSTIDADDNP